MFLFQFRFFSWSKLKNYRCKFAPMGSFAHDRCVTVCVHFDRHITVQKPLGNSLLSTSAGAEYVEFA